MESLVKEKENPKSKRTTNFGAEMSSEEEKKPLLSSATPSAPAAEQPPPYEQPTIPAPLPESNGSALGGQQPPPYSTVNAAGGMTGQTMFVQCRVCQHVIHVSSESHTRVVKCSNCREATVSLNVDYTLRSSWPYNLVHNPLPPFQCFYMQHYKVGIGD